VLRTDLTDHRGTDDARLLSALGDGDAIALAEAYHRTITAAHACARRLLASPVEIEALMRAVYSDLWDEPPVDTALEGWVRARCFNLGAGYLRQRSLRAPSASLAAFTSGVDADGHASNDALEQMISELSEQQQAALVRAHDQGIPTSEQEDPEAGWALLHALLALASPLTDDERHAAEMCPSGVALANWTFGLLPPHEAATVPGTAAEPTPCGRLAGVLRRARRRFEPLPPTPDLGHRVLASVLSNGSARQPLQASGASLDSDLRIAYADLGRSQPAGDEPTSSLDMPLPSPVSPQADEEGLPRDNGRRAPRGWDAIDDDGPAPAQPAGPSGLATAPPGSGNVSRAFPAAPPDPHETVSDDLVRMPLRRVGQRPLPPDGGGPATTPLPQGDPSILRPGTPVDQDATIPPSGLRERHQDRDQHGQPPPRGLHGPEPDPEPAEPAFGSEQRGLRSDHDAGMGSPLRRPPRGLDTGSRPAPPPRGLDTGPRPAPPPRGLDTGSRPAPPPRGLDTGSRPAPPPRGLDTGSRPVPPSRTLDSHPGLRRDDSDPRLGDAFADDDMTMPPATATTTAAMPAMRRSQPSAAPTRMPSGPPPMSTEPPPERESSGSASILRWVIVVVLVALGAAVGIWLGQMMIT
jgi:DNA-directed RNA polymerase specialized sigma24 family protein